MTFVSKSITQKVTSLGMGEEFMKKLRNINVTFVPKSSSRNGNSINMSKEFINVRGHDLIPAHNCPDLPKPIQAYLRLPSYIH